MISTLYFGEGSFLFQHDCAPVHKTRPTKTCLNGFGLEELDWLTQSPDLNCIEHCWYELQWRLWTRTSWPKSVPDLIHALLDEWSTFQNGQNTPKSCGEPSQKSGRCYSCKGVTNSILMSMYLKCSVIKVPFGMVRCSNMFVHIV